MNRIDVQGVDKVFHEPDGSNLQILSNISLHIHEKELIVIKGPSGSGKTTLLNIITGLLQPTTGSVYFNGLNISRLGLRQLSMYRLKYIGYLFQHWNLLPFLSAKENIAVPQRILGSSRSDRHQLVEAFSKSLGIFDRLNNRPDEMSGGQKQRVALARALINNPSFLLADEPTSNLDVKTRTAIVKILQKKRKEGLGLVITTHDPFFEEIADRVYILDKSKVTITKTGLSKTTGESSL